MNFDTFWPPAVSTNARVNKILDIIQIPDESLQQGLVAILLKYKLKAVISIDTVTVSAAPFPPPSFQLTLRRNADTPLVFREPEHVFDDEIALRGVYVNALRWLADLFTEDTDLELFRGIRL